MFKRLLILMFIPHAAGAMDSMADFPQHHTRSNSGSQILAPVPYASCQSADNRPREDDNKELTSQPKGVIETGRMIIANAMGRIYSGFPQ